MSDYRDSEREVAPKHCGNSRPHRQHEWHEMSIGRHTCTGNLVEAECPCRFCPDPVTCVAIRMKEEGR